MRSLYALHAKETHGSREVAGDAPRSAHMDSVPLSEIQAENYISLENAYSRFPIALRYFAYLIDLLRVQIRFFPLQLIP